MRRWLSKFLHFINHNLKKDFYPQGNHLGFFSWDHSIHATKLRLLIIILGYLIAFLVIATKLTLVASHEYISKKEYTERGNKYRRDIIDRNGNLLAVNLPASSLFANPRKVIDAEGSATKLAAIFPDMDKNKLLASLKSNKSFTWVKRDMTPKEQEQVYNVGLPGFEFENEYKRIYIYGNLFSHVVGYVNRDLQGLSGIEQGMDKFLSGEEIESTKTDPNAPLQLSLDVRLQGILSEELETVIKEFNAKGGAGIITDMKGEILALVSKPDFDPHNPSRASPQQLFNMATLGVYEMGSGMKIVTVSVGLDTGTVTLNDAYDLSYMKIGKYNLKDYYNRTGWNSVGELFAHSSNIGVGQIILEVGGEVFRDYVKKLGLLNKVKLELPECGMPLFPSQAKWSDVTLITMSYGYSMSESPASVVQAILPVVNGGVKYPLTLIKRPSGVHIEGERVFKESTSASMRKLLRLVVTEGSSKKAEVNGYYVGGKSGTAEKIVDGRYVKNKRLSSFLGIIPANDPKYMIYISIDEPEGSKKTYGFATGSWTSAKVAGAVFEKMVILYGLEKPNPEDQSLKELLDIDYYLYGKT